MIRILLLLPVLQSIVVAVQPIAIRNGSFEEGVTLGEGAWSGGNIPSWEDRASASSASGTFNPDSPLNFAPNGNHVVFFNTGGFINQDLKLAGGANVTAQPGMV